MSSFRILEEVKMVMEELKNLTYLSDTFVGERKIYEDVTPPEKRSGILRIVEGPLAEYGSLNRNKRMYTEQLWDNVLESSYVKEQLSYNTLYGECNHPTDRYEIDFERVSHSIVKLWKVPATNQIYGRIYILDTPFGRILNTLYDAGGIIGYSSRAGGTLHQRKDYIDVDEKTYNFITFDAVPYPSVVSARPGIVSEGAQELVKLPEEVHDKLCKIILESGARNNIAMKDFIYSIDGYDMTRERQLLESSEPVKTETEQGLTETTLSLLKESSSQIDGLKADMMVLKTTNTSLTAENENLKARLNESLEQLTKLGIESKRQESVINESTSSHNDTIAKLEARINELNSVIEDKDLELEEMSNIQEAFKVLQSENAGMRASISNEKEVAESFQSFSTRVEDELKEAYSEISSMVKEAQDKDSEIRSLNESVEDLKSKLSSEMSKVKDLNKEIKSLRSEKTQLVKESKSLDEKSSDIIDNLKEENSRLESKVERLNESIEQLKGELESSVNESKENSVYADSLIEVIAGNYGMSVSTVKSKLHEGFTKDDVYRVCESFSNAVINGVSYDSVAESVTQISDNKENKSTNPVPKVAAMMENAGNRRGIGIIK